MRVRDSLQSFHLADNRGPWLAVLAALLHDCGQMCVPFSCIELFRLGIHSPCRLPKHILDAQIHSSSFLFDPSSPEIGTNMLLPSGRSVGKHGHDVIGGLYLASLGFPPEVWELVRDHVVAKRYLTAVEEGYHHALSEASKLSLGFQVYVSLCFSSNLWYSLFEYIGRPVLAFRDQEFWARPTFLREGANATVWWCCKDCWCSSASPCLL